MSAINILVAEDDQNILTGLIDLLESEGYQARGAGDGQKALEAFQDGGFDLVILDIMMPEKSGYDVCREIRALDENVPILMLTAKSEEMDKVVGFKLGADDYVTKPFGVSELLARIHALLRRSQKNSGQKEAEEPQVPDSFSFGPARINALEYKAVTSGQTFELSAKELDLIKAFFVCPGRVLDRDHLLNKVWGIEYFGTTRTLDQHIAMLRKKIEPDPANPKVITTVHGIG